MRIILLTILIFFTVHLNATVYYFSNTGNDNNNGTSTGTPFQTLAKAQTILNAANPGDQVFFKRGDTWYGSLNLTRNGSSGNPIVIGAYGTGARPIIEGWTTLTSWTSTGSNTYETTIPSTITASIPLRSVLFDGVHQPIGRWPKVTPTLNDYFLLNTPSASRGYKTITGNTSNAITDATLNTTDSWVGATAVWRANAWNIQFATVNSHNLGSRTLTMTNSSSERKAGWGYFLQNHNLILTPAYSPLMGDWAATTVPSTATANLRIYLGATIPAAHTIRAATVEDIITITSRSYIVITGLEIRGADNQGIAVTTSNNITITDCEIHQCGQNGISHHVDWQNFNASSFLTYTSNIIHDVWNIGINAWNASDVNIIGNDVRHCGLARGLGYTFGQHYSGIQAASNRASQQNVTIEYNTVVGVGADGIVPRSSGTSANMRCRFNRIDSAGQILSDNGGIYMGVGNSSNSLVEGNIITNVYGDNSGSVFQFPDQGHGIYHDEDPSQLTTGMIIRNNFIANANGAGIFVHENINHTITGNTVYNAMDGAVRIQRDVERSNNRNIVLTGNILFSKYRRQNPIEVQCAYGSGSFTPNDIDQIQTNKALWNNNYLIRPFSNEGLIWTETGGWASGPFTERYMSVPAWTARYGYDATSTLSPVNVTPFTVSSYGSNLFSNPTFSSTSGVSIEGGSSISIDAGALKVTPSDATDNYTRVHFSIGAVTAGKKYSVKFNIRGATAERTLFIHSPNSFEFRNNRQSPAVTWQTSNQSREVQLNMATTAGSSTVTMSSTRGMGIFWIDDLEVREMITYAEVNPDTLFRLEINPSLVPKVVDLGTGIYRDAANVLYDTSMILQPYTGKILIKTGTGSPASNVAPSAYAGLDTAITLPASTAALHGSGTDIDGTITTYAWTKLTGSPAGGTISNSAIASPTISALQEGTYQFRLLVTDNGGLTDADTMSIVVNPQPANILPTATAGPDKTIVLPVSSVTIYGDGFDSDGTYTVLWTRLSGPNTPTFTPNATSDTITLSGLIAGTYVMKLAVTDDRGGVALDTMNVLVTANQFPIAGAGIDKTIQLPTSTSSASGTDSDPDGTISSRLWSQVSGPSAAGITGSTTANAGFNTLIEGVYQFRYGVTDNGGLTSYDTMKVTVLPTNISPIAAAGSNQTIQLPLDQVSLNGGSSTDPDGTITTYLWQKIVGTGGSFSASSSVNTDFTGLSAGTYSIKLTVTDNQSATGLDTMIITVLPANVAPSVDAGPNDTIQLPVSSYILNPVKSDPDGFIDSISVVKIAGPNTPTYTPNQGSLPVTISNLIQGQYTFRVWVYDNQGASDFDDIIITVLAANVLPTASAGTDKTMRLPINSTTLNGTSGDADGTITVLWTKQSGPATFAITSPTNDTTGLTNLVAGVYIFRLTVTDNNGAETIDEVMVTVNPANVLPVVSAGTDKTITLPVDSVIQVGSASDADGTIDSLIWTQVSGPNTANIVSIHSATTVIKGLIAGTYVFQLKAYDNEDSVRTDQMTIIVLPVPPNQPPVANAGANATIALPASSVTLNGSLSADADGTIVSYSWAKISGTGGTIVTPTLVNTSVTGLTLGSYLLRLTVTDNDGATDTSDVIVIVAEQSSQIKVRGKFVIKEVEE